MHTQNCAPGRLLAAAMAVMASGGAQAWEVPLGYSHGNAKLDGHVKYANETWYDFSFDTWRGGGKESSSRLFIGVFPWKSFGLEYGSVDFGTSKVTAESDGCCLFGPGQVVHKISADGTELSLVGRIPVGQKIGLLLRAGQLSWDGKERIDASNGFAEGGDDGTDPFFGVGVDYRFPIVSLRGEYTDYSLGDFDVSRLSLSFVLHIGADPRKAE